MKHYTLKEVDKLLKDNKKTMEELDKFMFSRNYPIINGKI